MAALDYSKAYAVSAWEYLDPIVPAGLKATEFPGGNTKTGDGVHRWTQLGWDERDTWDPTPAQRGGTSGGDSGGSGVGVDQTARDAASAATTAASNAQTAATTAAQAAAAAADAAQTAKSTASSAATAASNASTAASNAATKADAAQSTASSAASAASAAQTAASDAAQTAASAQSTANTASQTATNAAQTATAAQTAVAGKAPITPAVNVMSVTGDVVMPPHTDKSMHHFDLKAAAPKINLPAPVAGGQHVMRFRQDATGNRAPVLTGSFRWSNGIAHEFSTAANADDVLMMLSFDGVVWDVFSCGFMMAAAS